MKPDETTTLEDFECDHHMYDVIDTIWEADGVMCWECECMLCGEHFDQIVPLDFPRE